MPFNPAKLPDKEEIKLSETVHFLAFGETYDLTSQREVGSPSVRALDAEITLVLKRCLDEVGSDAKHFDFVDLVRKPGLWNADPIAPQFSKYEASWPPSGQRLYALVEQLDRAVKEDRKHREAATSHVAKWFDSGKVVFKGKRGAHRESIDRHRICEPQVFWENEMIVAYPDDSGNAQPGTTRQQLIWEDVVIVRASLVTWLQPPAPDPAQFDPMQQDDWTLPMAVAWIRRKSADAVREQWPAWLEQCVKRRLRDDGHYYLEALRRASLTELIAASLEDKQAWCVLRQALHNGSLSATLASTAIAVPAAAWAEQMEKKCDPNSVEPLDEPNQQGSDGLDYDDIRLKRAAVLRLQSRPASSSQHLRRAKEYLKPILSGA